MSAVGQSNPFSDASEYNSLAFIIARATDEMQTVSIVQVKAVNTGALTVDVQVLVNLVTGANISVPHGVISARPYFRAQGGTSGIILDPVVGDIGVMVFASRDSSAVIAAKGAANPGSQRRFSWSDGVYFGGILNTAPTQYIQFLPSGGGITLLTPGAAKIQAATLEVTCPTTFDSTVNIDGLTTATTIDATTVNATTVAATSVDATNLNVAGGGSISFPPGSLPSNVLAASGVTAGSYTAANITVNAEGIITAAANGTGGGGGTVTSVATGTGLTGGPITTSGTIALANTTVTPGSYTYATLTIDAQGRITAASSGAAPTGTVTSVGISTPGVGVVVGGGPVTTAGTLTVDLSSTAYAALTLATTAIQPSEVADSIVFSGGALQLSGDAATPGNTYYYGTNGLGVKGWYVLTTGSGTVTSVGISTSTLQLGGTNPVTGAGTISVDLTSAQVADLALAATSVQPGGIQNLESAGWNSSSGAIVLSLTVPQDILIPYGCTLREVYILTQGGSGSCTVSLTKCPIGSFPGGLTDITGGVSPAISSSSLPYTNTTLSGWTTALSQNDIIRCTLQANTNFTSVKILLRMY